MDRIDPYDPRAWIQLLQWRLAGLKSFDVTIREEELTRKRVLVSQFGDHPGFPETTRPSAVKSKVIAAP